MIGTIILVACVVRIRPTGKNGCSDSESRAVVSLLSIADGGDLYGFLKHVWLPVKERINLS